MTPNEIRNIALKGIFSSEYLMDIVTLKGGNAMQILSLTNRESQDLDFSIQEGKRLSKEVEGKEFETCITEAFLKHGIKVISFKFEDKPLKRRTTTPPYWGGYKIEFSIMTASKFSELTPVQLKNINAYAEPIDGNKKKVKIDLSFDEYTDSRIKTKVEDFCIYIYSPLMIVYEKIRASCQQLPEYQLSSEKTRSRDLFDIYTMLASKDGMRLREEVLNSENFHIIYKMFKLKNVDISLMLNLETIKRKLRMDYDVNVRSQVPENEAFPKFDFIFQYIQELYSELYSQLVTLKSDF